MARQQRPRELLIDIESLRRRTAAPRHLVIDTTLEDLAVTDSAIAPDESIHVDATLEAVHEGVLVTGTVTTRWTGQCRRCLEPAEGVLDVAVRELCMENGDEETTYPLAAETVDLVPIVHDACILNLPLAPLCVEGCLGLCPSCGVNRNLELCLCRPGHDPRFASLSLLASGWADEDEPERSGGEN